SRGYAEILGDIAFGHGDLLFRTRRCNRRSGACGVEGPLALPSLPSRAVPVPTPVRSGSGSKGSHVECPVVSQPLSGAPLGNGPVSRETPARVKRHPGAARSRRVGLDCGREAAQDHAALLTIKGETMSTSSLPVARAQISPATLVLAFIAGALAVPVFHQILLLVLYLAKVVPFAPFSWAPTKPLGVPDVISISFWGGVWGIVFALTVRQWFRGAAYWAAAAIIGGVALTLVFMFVVWPLKIGGLPPDMVGLFVIGFVLNAAWGIGWALFLLLFERMRA